MHVWNFDFKAFSGAICINLRMCVCVHFLLFPNCSVKKQTALVSINSHSTIIKVMSRKLALNLTINRGIDRESRKEGERERDPQSHKDKS